MKKIQLTLVLLLFITFKGFAYQLNYTQNIQEAHLLILEYEFDKADSLLNIEKKKQPDNLYISCMYVYKSFLKAYFNTNTESYEAFKKISEDVSEKLEDFNTDEANTLIANIALYEGFIHFLWDEKYEYAMSIFRGKKYIGKVKDSYHEKKRIQSLYEVLAYGIPDKYKVFASWFDFEGDAMVGLNMIDSFLKDKEISPAQKIEGQIFQMYLHHFLDIPFKKSDYDFKSPLLLYVYLQTSSISATKKLELIEQFAKKDLRYFSYLKGKMLLLKQEQKGYAILQNYIKHTTSNAFKHDALYQMYSYNFCNNKLQDAEKCKNDIMSLPTATFPIDKKIAKKLSIHRPASLIKAGMLFDAGMYQESLATLKKVNPSVFKNDSHKLEYQYRLARNYHQLNQEEKALKIYAKVIASNLSEIYFVPFSSYQSGKIFKKRKNYKKASEFFNKTFELNQGEYEHSINLKTKFALDYLK